MNELERLKTQVWELNGVNEYSWKPNIADRPLNWLSGAVASIPDTVQPDTYEVLQYAIKITLATVRAMLSDKQLNDPKILRIILTKVNEAEIPPYFSENWKSQYKNDVIDKQVLCMGDYLLHTYDHLTDVYTGMVVGEKFLFWSKLDLNTLRYIPGIIQSLYAALTCALHLRKVGCHTGDILLKL